MAAREPRTRRIRSIFVSDVHLGCKHSRAAALATFLEAHQPDYLFLVGDFIDGWKLKKVWRWPDEYSAVIRRLIELAESGTRICYTPGNHDDFLRKYLYDFGLVDVRDEFIYRTADGRKLLITHGDKFDRFEQSARWFTMSLSFVYDAILSMNRLVGRFERSRRCRGYAFSAKIKLLCKRFAMFVSDYERRLVDYARAKHCDGVVCGHIHKPEITFSEDLLYFNTGDWVEHCTALVEYDQGQIELLFLLPNDANDRLTVVERRTEPSHDDRPVTSDGHDEFEDGFNHRAQVSSENRRLG